MGFFTMAQLSVIGLAILQLALASPMPVNGLAPRAVPIRIVYCTQINFKGQCNEQAVNQGSCANVPASYNDQISSIKNPDTKIGKCKWFLNGGCTGESYDNQEDANLADGNGKFDDSISSIHC